MEVTVRLSHKHVDSHITFTNPKSFEADSEAIHVVTVDDTVPMRFDTKEWSYSISYN